MSFVRRYLNPRSVSNEVRQAALDRVHSDPGIPDSKRTSAPFWLKDPHPVVGKVQSDNLPEEADIVIIGSGITGVSVAYTLLSSANQDLTSNASLRPTVLMLEARDVSSGATGRNGGHILETVDEYDDLKEIHGKDAAIKITRFKLAHLDEITKFADEQGITEEAQVRRVRFVSAFFDEAGFAYASETLKVFKTDMPEEAKDFQIHSAQEAKDEFYLPQAAGVITGPAGALWPYKFTTAILAKLCQKFPDAFKLETNTPVTKIIEAPSENSSHPFQLVTPRGSIRTKHIIHCSNGHVGHLVPGLVGRVFPVRGQMSAQTAGEKFPFQGEKHSWLLSYEEGYDYLTQLPINGSSSNGEMMLGGGLAQTRKQGLEELGIATDYGTNVYADIHLSGALSAAFGRENWGAVPGPGPSVKSMWTGTMGFSADGLAWVGKLPPSLTQRNLVVSESGSSTAAEWVAAAFSGEGMVNTWLSGKALAIMVLAHEKKLKDGVEEDISSWFPEPMLVTEERIAKAQVPRRVDEWKDL